VITYRATLDVPRELVHDVAGLLRAERRRRGTRRGTRALTCFWQAILVLRWFRDRTDPARLGRDHQISRATAYRYLDEGIAVLAACAPNLHEALERAAGDGLPYVILDGTVVESDRCAEKTISVKGKLIDLWYSGKAHRHGGNVQAVFAPDGFPLWVSQVAPGSHHDLTVARDQALGARSTPRPNTCRPWLTAATTAQAPASTPRSRSPTTAGTCTWTTRPSTCSCGPCAVSVNAGSPCSPAAGAPSSTSPPAPAESATSPKPHSPSSISTTAGCHESR